MNVEGRGKVEGREGERKKVSEDRRREAKERKKQWLKDTRRREEGGKRNVHEKGNMDQRGGRGKEAMEVE